MQQVTVNLPCPQCSRDIPVKLNEWKPGQSQSCPACGEKIFFKDDPAVEIQAQLAAMQRAIEGQNDASGKPFSFKFDVTTKVQKVDLTPGSPESAEIREKLAAMQRSGEEQNGVPGKPFALKFNFNLTTGARKAGDAPGISVLIPGRQETGGKTSPKYRRLFNLLTLLFVVLMTGAVILNAKQVDIPVLTPAAKIFMTPVVYGVWLLRKCHLGPEEQGKTMFSALVFLIIVALSAVYAALITRLIIRVKNSGGPTFPQPPRRQQLKS